MEPNSCWRNPDTTRPLCDWMMTACLQNKSLQQEALLYDTPFGLYHWAFHAACQDHYCTDCCHQLRHATSQTAHLWPKGKQQSRHVMHSQVCLGNPNQTRPCYVCVSPQGTTSTTVVLPQCGSPFNPTHMDSFLLGHPTENQSLITHASKPLQAQATQQPSWHAAP
jgi:hypothetical protein